MVVVVMNLQVPFQPEFLDKSSLPPAYVLVLAEIFFDPADGGDMFLRNVGCISTDYTAPHPRR
jgi:hypothetical protein